jgi:hypothetical protein
MRSEVTSRSNWAIDKSTLQTARDQLRLQQVLLHARRPCLVQARQLGTEMRFAAISLLGYFANSVRALCSLS